MLACNNKENEQHSIYCEQIDMFLIKFHSNTNANANANANANSLAINKLKIDTTLQCLNLIT